jgi:hypothetical protein
MSIRVAQSTATQPATIAQQLRGQLGQSNTRLVLYFASSQHHQTELAKTMHEAFGDTTLVGCTTAGEIISGHMLKGSVVAMGFDSDAVDQVIVDIVPELKTHNRVEEAFQRFEQQLGCSMAKLDHRQYVGIILTDGLSGGEEKVMERIGDLTNVQFIGASAGDDLKFQQTHVHANGTAHTDCAVLVLLKPKVGFEFLKTQSFTVLDKPLVATRVNEATRTVEMFNDQPAAIAYAQAIGCAREEAGSQFMTHPVGLMVGQEPYVRSPQQLQGDNMVFYCNIRQGMELKLLRSGDIVKDTQRALAEKLEIMGGASAIINFHCILRTLELEQRSQTEGYGKLFSHVPTIGFSTYGEQFIGHINQTSTMLLFK